MAGPVRWLPKAARYYDMGVHRLVSRDSVLAEVQNIIDQSAKVTTVLTQKYLDGGLAARDWETMMRGEIKRRLTEQYFDGIGGRENMTPADWGRVGAMCKKQYGFLAGFRADLESGQSTGGRALNRAQMYANATRQGFERAHLEAMKRTEKGVSSEVWLLGAAEHCSDCLEYAGMGWQPLGTFPFPGDGSTICKSNCACTKAYR